MRTAGVRVSIAGVMADRQPHRRADHDPTPARVLGVAGVCGLFAVLIVAIAMIAGAGGGDGEASFSPATTPTATPTVERESERRPERMTAAERAERRTAVALVESKGFAVTRPGDWESDDDLRVLIGASEQSGGQLAFFFSAAGDYLGNDSPETSAELRVRGGDELAVTLAYGIFAEGDTEEPTAEPALVEFRYDGASLEPVQLIPPVEDRAPR